MVIAVVERWGGSNYIRGDGGLWRLWRRADIAIEVEPGWVLYIFFTNIFEEKECRFPVTDVKLFVDKILVIALFFFSKIIFFNIPNMNSSARNRSRYFSARFRFPRGIFLIFFIGGRSIYVSSSHRSLSSRYRMLSPAAPPPPPSPATPLPPPSPPPSSLPFRWTRCPFPPSDYTGL